VKASLRTTYHPLGVRAPLLGNGLLVEQGWMQAATLLQAVVHANKVAMPCICTFERCALIRKKKGGPVDGNTNGAFLGCRLVSGRGGTLHAADLYSPFLERNFCSVM